MMYVKDLILAAATLILFSHASPSHAAHLRLGSSSSPCFGIQISANGNAAAWFQREPISGSAYESSVVYLADLDSGEVKSIYRGSTAGMPYSQKSFPDDGTRIEGPHFVKSDRNYSVAPVGPRIRLSPDGTVVMINMIERWSGGRGCGWGIYNRNKGSWSYTPAIWPQGMALPVWQENYTDPVHWANFYDILPDGSALAYMVAAPNIGPHRYAGALLVSNFDGSGARRLAGYTSLKPDSYEVQVQADEPWQLRTGRPVITDKHLFFRAYKPGTRTETAYSVALSGGRPSAVLEKAQAIEPVGSRAAVALGNEWVFFGHDGTELGRVPSKRFQMWEFPAWRDNARCIGLPGIRSKGTKVQEITADGEATLCELGKDGLPGDGWHIGVTQISSAHDYRLVTPDATRMILPLVSADRQSMQLYCVTLAERSAASGAVAGQGNMDTAMKFLSAVAAKNADGAKALVSPAMQQHFAWDTVSEACSWLPRDWKDSIESRRLLSVADDKDVAVLLLKPQRGQSVRMEVVTTAEGVHAFIWRVIR